MSVQNIPSVFTKDRQKEVEMLIRCGEFGGVGVKTKMLCLEYAVLSESDDILKAAKEFYEFVMSHYMDDSSAESSSTDK